MSDSPAPAVPRALLPGELVADGGADPVRRTTRDWVVDALAFGWSVLMWAVMSAVTHGYDHLPGWLKAADVQLGAVACLAVWWRRSHPLAVMLVLIPIGAVCNSAFGAGMVVLLNLGLRVPWQRSLPVLCLSMLAAMPYVLVYSVPHEGGWIIVVLVVAYHLVFFAWGSALRARRMLVLRLREDAERERAEHARRLAETRRTEREAIAREMHDVLAHRISLLSVHAGALAYRTRQAEAAAGPELSAAEVSETAQVIRDNAHQALEELRAVLHVLRRDEERGDPAGEDGGGALPPQPRMADVKELVDEVRASGQQVDFRGELDEQAAAGLRPQLQRTAYRVVQEGLTNVRKHAPGARVTVRLAGGPGGELTVAVANPLPVGVTDSEIPGAGAGLTGLGERVGLEGGTLEYGTADGTFTLRARLPWPAR